MAPSHLYRFRSQVADTKRERRVEREMGTKQLTPAVPTKRACEYERNLDDKGMSVENAADLQTTQSTSAMA